MREAFISQGQGQHCVAGGMGDCEKGEDEVAVGVCLGAVKGLL